MTTRRNLLKSSLAGLMFCGCGLPMTAHAQGAPARLPLTVKGKRIKTIDVHAHCFFQQGIDAAGEKLEAVTPKVLGGEKLIVTLAHRLKEKEDMGMPQGIRAIK